MPSRTVTWIPLPAAKLRFTVTAELRVPWEFFALKVKLEVDAAVVVALVVVAVKPPFASAITFTPVGVMLVVSTVRG